MTLKRARSKSLRAPFLFPFLPQYPPSTSPIFSLSGEFFGGKVPFFPRSSPRNPPRIRAFLAAKGPILSPKSSSNERFLTQKLPIFSPFYPQKLPRVSDFSRKNPLFLPLLPPKLPLVSCLDGRKLTEKPLNLSKNSKILPRNPPESPPREGWRLGEWVAIWLGIRP